MYFFLCFLSRHVEDCYFLSYASWFFFLMDQGFSTNVLKILGVGSGTLKVVARSGINQSGFRTLLESYWNITSYTDPEHLWLNMDSIQIFFFIPCSLPPLMSTIELTVVVTSFKRDNSRKNGHSVILYVVLMYRLLNFFKLFVFLLAKYFQSVIVAV